ncbi:MAG: Ig-like domain-containing protein [Candidatus Eisenbacteria sp.]|nr:Ig-like domain-containing protein [Candidatus Eisenbacteria bacterium]
MAALGLACARIVPPKGGPADEQAPLIVAHAPDSGAVRIEHDGPLWLEFSEKMNRSSVRDWLLIAPWPGKLSCQWEGTRVTCAPEQGWAEQTTYTVVLGTQATDRRRNQFAAPFELSFTTGDSLPTGQVTGEVRTRALKPGGLTVCLLPWPGELPGLEGREGPDTQEALRIGQTNATGQFTMRHVPRATAFLLGALWDRNGNRHFDERDDIWGFADGPVSCPQTGDGIQEVVLYVVYADEPGDIGGEVSDTLCAQFVPPPAIRARLDSLQRILTGELDAMGFEPGTDSIPEAQLTPAEEESVGVQVAALEKDLARACTDSLRCSAAIWVAAHAEGDTTAADEVRTQGAYEISGLDSGLYRLQAFRDINGNGRRDEQEPHDTFPSLVELLPGRRVEGVDLELREESEPRSDSSAAEPEPSAAQSDSAAAEPEPSAAQSDSAVVAPKHGGAESNDDNSAMGKDREAREER